MNQKNNGGPAFPNVPDGAGDKWQDWDTGMTLRDYFAAKALATVAAYDSHDIDTWTPHDFAHHAYALADAMLAERAK